MSAKRYSRQRELIYEVLAHSREHPTADMVYHTLKPANPNLSLGTVYRNLNLLVSEGRVVRMPFPVERYDADITPHPHFVCQVCGCVTDLDLPYDPSLDQAAAQAGHQVEGHSLLFTGVCVHCRSRQQTGS